MDYNWPGNVRELENIVERELIRHRGGALSFDALLPREDMPQAREEGAPFPALGLDEAMAAHISQVLRLTNGKIHGPGGAAELLCVNPNTLRWRIDKLGIGYERKKRGLLELRPQRSFSTRRKFNSSTDDFTSVFVMSEFLSIFTP